MDKNFSRAEIFQAVRECIANSLALDESELTETSRLIDDLGADSLDFLDIIFGLEKQFAIKLRDPSIELLARADFSQEKLREGGNLSKESIERLSEYLPAIKEAAAQREIAPQEIYSFITVNTLILLVERKLAEPEAE